MLLPPYIDPRATLAMTERSSQLSERYPADHRRSDRCPRFTGSEVVAPAPREERVPICCVGAAITREEGSKHAPASVPQRMRSEVWSNGALGRRLHEPCDGADAPPPTEIPGGDRPSRVHHQAHVQRAGQQATIGPRGLTRTVQQVVWAPEGGPRPPAHQLLAATTGRATGSGTGPGHRAGPPSQATEPGHRVRPRGQVTGPGHRAGPPGRATGSGHRAGPQAGPGHRPGRATGSGHRAGPPGRATEPGHRAGPPGRVTVPGHRAGSPCRVTGSGHRAGPGRATGSGHRAGPQTGPRAGPPGQATKPGHQVRPPSRSHQAGPRAGPPSRATRLGHLAGSPGRVTWSSPWTWCSWGPPSRGRGRCRPRGGG